MSNTAKLLLLDVLRLRAAYSDKDFEAVVRILRLKEQDEVLSSVLELVRDVAELSAARPKAKRNLAPSEATLKQLMQQIKEADDPRYTTLSEIQNVVQSKLAFPTVTDLQQFASRRTTLPTGKTSRAQVVAAYLTSLVGLPIGDLELELQELKQQPTKENEAIAGALRMANKIVESHRR